METIIDKVVDSLYEPNRWYARAYYTGYGYTLYDPKTGTSICVVYYVLGGIPPALSIDGYEIRLTSAQQTKLSTALTDWRQYYRDLAAQKQVAKMAARWEDL